MPLFLPDPTYSALHALPRRRRSRLWVPPGTSGPTPPANFLDDTFTDANGTLLTAHTPNPNGGTWGLQTGSGGSCSINSNRAYATSATAMVNSATPPSANYVVAAQLVPLSVDHNTSWGVMGRADPASYTFYTAFIYGYSGVFSLFLSVFLASSYYNLTNVGLPSQPTLGSSHEIKLSMVGSAISVYWDGVQLITPFTDANITTAGKAGIYLANSTTTTGVHVDSITAT